MSEEVPYEVERVIDGVEVRRYAPVTLATVRQAADNEAFAILFRYITGHNRSPRGATGQRIPMTAPVFSDSASFSFAMPAGYSKATAPLPLDSRPAIEELPARRVAVLRFGGVARPDRVERKMRQLLATLSLQDLRSAGSPFLMRYDPPFKPGFMRRNEVGVEVLSCAETTPAA